MDVTGSKRCRPRHDGNAYAAPMPQEPVEPTGADPLATGPGAAAESPGPAGRAGGGDLTRVDGDSAMLRRAAHELLRRSQAGLGMTVTTAHYRQFELAELLHTIARSLEVGDVLPSELVRHAANLARHINDYPSASSEPPT